MWDWKIIDSVAKKKGNFLHKYDPLRNRCTEKNIRSMRNGQGKVLLFMCLRKRKHCLKMANVGGRKP